VLASIDYKFKTFGTIQNTATSGTTCMLYVLFS